MSSRGYSLGSITEVCMNKFGSPTALVAVVVGLLLSTNSGSAQGAAKHAVSTFPVRPVRLVVPVPPGGSSDASARILGQKLADSWGHQVIIDNRAGAAEIIGTEIV